MSRFSPEDVRLERWTDRLYVPEDTRAQAAKAVLEAHFLAEWNDDIEGTMATMDPVDPFQRVPALGVEIRGVEAVRRYYLNRFETWPGPAMERFDRVTVSPEAVIVEGDLRLPANSDVAPLSGPAVIVVDIRDGKVRGETVYAAPRALSSDRPGTSE